jgi:glycosyltransferase involved in cell wall biosynthesis
MIHLFLNGLGASAGAGLTYLFNVLPQLSTNTSVRVTVAVQPQLRSEFDRFRNTTVLDLKPPASTAARFWFEQRKLPELIRQSGADVLISAGNFALRNSPVPQILLSGNSLYTSSDFPRDLWGRGEVGMLLDTSLKGFFAKKSLEWADCTIAPSQAFADELARWTGRKAVGIYHGFDHELFFRDQSPLSDEVQRNLADADDSLKLLFVSHYNYYRNFETLFRALPLIREKLGRKVRLFLTCKLEGGTNPGTYKTGRAAKLIEQLAVSDEVVQLGAVRYRSLHHLYRACDIYVTPAYAETFAHPLVEAMASGLPIAASDLPVHREVTAGSACFFPRFSSEHLAACILRLASDSELRRTLSANGKRRSLDFSWSSHVNKLIELAHSNQRRPNVRAATAA